MVFTKSDNFKSEYSCAVVKIGQLTPIEGSDFLAKTLVQGIQIVVRKDLIKEGDIVLYAANETQLSEQFLAVNNLFDFSCREKNSNHEQISEILAPYTELKPQVTAKREQIKSLKRGIGRENNQLKKKGADTEALKQSIAQKQEVVDRLNKEIEELTLQYEPCVKEAKKGCGFFNKHGRVRCITLRNEPSFGFIFSQDNLMRFAPSVTEQDIADYVGQEFDTVCGELFCKAYVPPVRQKLPRDPKKAKKNVKPFDRLIEGTSVFHYDTEQLQKCITRIRPTDVVTCSVKIHGTSVIVGRIMVKQPKSLFIGKRLVNWACSLLGAKQPFADYYTDYGPVYSSRTLVRNQFVVKGETPEADIWSQWGDIIYPYLQDDVEVYGEIFGYLEDGKYVQQDYDYGCDRLVSKLMIYRVVIAGHELEVSEVKDWTLALIEQMKARGDANAHRLHPIDIVYHGTLHDLYPDVPLDEHWAEEVLERMKRDKATLGMEQNEPLCRNVVPREGVVVRIDGDPVKEAFKLKCQKFLGWEASQYDSDTYSDIEIAQAQ